MNYAAPVFLVFTLQLLWRRLLFHSVFLTEGLACIFLEDLTLEDGVSVLKGNQ